MHPLAQIAPQSPQTGAPGGYRPHPKLPSQDSLSYIKLGVELLLLLLAVPWILRELTHNPGRLSRKAAGKHLSD